MKTTVDLPDDLLIAAKKRAAELRVPLRTLIARGLQRELDAAAAAAKPRRRKIQWVTHPGGLPRGLDLTDRAAMHEWLSRRS